MLLERILAVTGGRMVVALTCNAETESRLAFLILPLAKASYVGRDRLNISPMILKSMKTPYCSTGYSRESLRR